MPTIEPNVAHVAYMNDLKAALGRHTNLSAAEMLAVAAQFVGNLTALQDQTRYTAGAVMAVVASNIQIGNAAAIADLMKPEGSS